MIRENKVVVDYRFFLADTANLVLLEEFVGGGGVLVFDRIGHDGRHVFSCMGEDQIISSWVVGNKLGDLFKDASSQSIARGLKVRPVGLTL